MNNWLVLPLIIPMLLGLIMAMFRKNIPFQRILSLISVLSTIGLSLYLISLVSSHGIQALQIGGWEAPFGITLAVDMFSAILLLVANIVTLICLFYGFSSIDRAREEYYFYPLVQFLLTGINGSFLTGDIFNLFVCFEVMLLSSYVLLSLGGTKLQLRESIKYILINVISSTLFLVGIAYLYGILGTLNFAHLSVRVAEAGQDPLITIVALLLLIVFSIKAALFFFFWLPGSYSSPPPVVAAVFAALLTKVGIYAIFRVFTLIFYHQPEITNLVIGIMAGLTMILGAIGAVAYWDVRKILAYNVIISVGFILLGLIAFTSESLMGSAYYLMHDMIIKALLFLLGGTTIGLVGTSKLKEMSGLIRNHPLLGWMFFIGALALAGVPPLSGFLGKTLILDGLLQEGSHSGLYWLAGIGIATSLMALYSVVKIFINGFWGETNLSEDMEKGTTKGLLVPCVLLLILSIGLGLGSEYVYPYIEQASYELMNPQVYIEAVLDPKYW